MFLNPQEVLNKKIITYPANIEISKFIQQNGLDIDCDKVFNLNLTQVPVVSNTVQVKPTIKEIKPTDISFASKELSYGQQGWIFEKGKVYSFESSFNIDIPEGMCGWVIGRSSFNRYGVLIRSSLFDSGYKGVLAGTIYAHNSFCVEKGSRIAQVVLAKAENAAMYDGQWQAKS